MLSVRIPGLALVPRLSPTGSPSHTQHQAWLLACWPWGAKHVSQQISDPLAGQAWDTETWSWGAVLRSGWGSAKQPVPSSHHASPHSQGAPIAGAGISLHRAACYCCTLTHSTCAAGLHLRICLHHVFLQCLSDRCHLKDQSGFLVSPCCLSFVGGRGTGRILLSFEHWRCQQLRTGYLQVMLQKLTALNTHLLN